MYLHLRRIRKKCRISKNYRNGNVENVVQKHFCFYRAAKFLLDHNQSSVQRNLSTKILYLNTDKINHLNMKELNRMSI